MHASCRILDDCSRVSCQFPWDILKSVPHKFMKNFEHGYRVSRVVNKICGGYTPWILFVISLIVFLLGEFSFATIIGSIIACLAFFWGGIEYGHGLGFNDGWNQSEKS